MCSKHTAAHENECDNIANQSFYFRIFANYPCSALPPVSLGNWDEGGYTDAWKNTKMGCLVRL